MGVRGRRIRKIDGEPKLYNNVNEIIEMAKMNGFIKGYYVDIEAIIRGNNELELIKDKNMESSISGKLHKDRIKNKWVITVNAKHHIKRQRFTMAHEFAHFVLHKDDKGQFVDEELYFRKVNDSSIEFNANSFAASLLMPEKTFIEAIQGQNITDISQLSDLFEVSAQAIEMRAKQIKQ